MEIKKCEICGFETSNGKVMSNHKRWKHIVEKDSEEYKSFLIKLKKSKSISFKYTCEKCGKEFEVVETKEASEKRKHWFCSRSCANSRGPRTEDFKRKVSLKLKNRNKKEKIGKICLFCGKEYFNGNEKYCCLEHRKLADKERHESIKSEFEIYREKCNFNFNLRDFPNEFDFSLIEKYGWYVASNKPNPNLNGVSRDHAISVRYGFENHIDPRIISHPANCILLRQCDNSKKGIKCSMTLEELLNRIELWNKKYGDVVNNECNAVLDNELSTASSVQI